MKNENIGALGEAFIHKRVENGIEFDSAWDDWQKVQDKLMFIVECPEVQFYDDRRISDCQERQRIRKFAKSRLGKHIRSEDVSLLGRIAAWAQIEVPLQPYSMDRQLVAEWLAWRAEHLELEYGMDEMVAEAKRIAESAEVVEALAADMERFSEQHSLWAVPPARLIGLYAAHRHRLHEASFDCNGCKSEIVVPVDHSAGQWQELRVACPTCRRWNKVLMSIDGKGEAHILSSTLDGGQQ
jgi:hypothetical protein